ncbi:uncharacterized protein LOC119986894 [Tripterygium wilfordii]|uniref:uncharacterized protein LOC119986894 n=1 Tax=Tripterygium wilfordii TaxID=458696 RepID=UPI0018F81815|nr:uncharacterized protein LOC119986894 [Tripterygium wilfordii]
MAVVVQAETMGDLDIPTIPESPSCIVLPTAARNYELKTIHFNMMPSFHGLSSEDPLSHIREILNMVSSMSLSTGVTEEHLRLKIFPYTMKDKARTWLNGLRPGSLATWTECPHHALPLLVLMRIFYKALTVYSKAAVNNYAGGSIRNMTPTECQNLFERLAIETQHSKVRGKRAGVYELNNSDTFAPRSQVDAIASKLDMLLAMNGRTIQQELCVICHVPGHATITCPQGVDFQSFQAHPNFSWKNTQNQANPPTTTLEDMVRQLAISQQKLEAQVGQIAEALSRREAKKFPSQTEINPNTREQAMAITVCDEQQSRVATDFGEQKAVDYNLKISVISNKIVTYQAKEQPRCTVMNGWSDPDKLAPPVRPYVPPIPFPGHLRRNKEEVQSLQKTNPKRDVEPSAVQEKNELDENKVVQLTEECSAISQTKLPPKLKDPGSALKKTSVGIQLADRSIRYPKGVLEDVLVKIHGLIFPADFLVLDMRDCQGTLTMTNNEETVTFKPKAAQVPQDKILQQAVFGKTEKGYSDPFEESTALTILSNKRHTLDVELGVDESECKPYMYRKIRMSSFCRILRFVNPTLDEEEIDDFMTAAQ